MVVPLPAFALSVPQATGSDQARRGLDPGGQVVRGTQLPSGKVALDPGLLEASPRHPASHYIRKSVAQVTQAVLMRLKVPGCRPIAAHQDLEILREGAAGSSLA